MIALADYSENVYRDEKRTEGNETVTDRYFRSDLIADGSADITAANAQGSRYLYYPAGTTITDTANKKLYILNASRTAFSEV